MFASRTSGELPWRAGQEVTVHKATLNGEPGGVVVRENIQHNEPNPILVDLRYQRRHSRLTASDLHDSFLDWLDHATPDNLYCREYGIAVEHINHARRVIVRLDNLTEGASA